MAIGLLTAGESALDPSASTGQDVADTVNGLITGDTPVDAITLKGLPQTASAPAGYGDLASAVGAFFTVTSEPSGVDDTAAIEQKIQQAKLAGGGTVRIPAGTWFAENLSVESGVTVVGDGWESTVIKLKVGAIHPLFKYKSSAILQMFNMEKLTLEGIGEAGPDGVDISSAASWSKSCFTDVAIKLFRRGVWGSQDDRKPIFTRVNYSECAVGHYVQYNHPFWVSCDFRECGIGLGGDHLYDSQITNCTFAYNDHGVKPDTGVIQSNISNCIFFTNALSDITVAARVSVNGCLFASGSVSAPTGVGIDVTGEGFVEICGNTFKSETGAYGGGCIRFSQSALSDQWHIVVSGNTVQDQKCFVSAKHTGTESISICNNVAKNIDDFFISSATGRLFNLSVNGNVGTNIKRFATVGSMTSGQNWQICNNAVRTKNYFLKSNTGTLNNVQSVIVRDNNVNQFGDSDISATDGVIQFAAGSTGCAYNVSGNCYKKEAAEVVNGYFIRMADASNCIIKDNIIRRSLGISLVTTNANTKNIDNIYLP